MSCLQGSEGHAARRDLIKGLGRKVSDESIPLYVRKASNASQDNQDSRKNSIGELSDRTFSRTMVIVELLSITMVLDISR